MLPYQVIAGGAFASDATQYFEVQLSAEPDLFILRNRSDWGNNAAVTAIESQWISGYAFGSADTTDQANATGILSSNAVLADGFMFINTASPPVFTPLAATAITAANPAVVAMASTLNIVPGSVVRVTQSTGMLQIAGYDFTVGTVVANTSIQLAYLNAAGFAAPATAAEVQLIIPGRFYPRWRYITGITQAAQCVVTFSVEHQFTVGERITLNVPSQFGMSQVAGRSGIVQAVTASTVTLNIDTTGFIAFAFPTSAVAAAGISPAVAVPAGAGPTPGANPPGVSTQAAIDNRNQYLMAMGSGVITEVGSTYSWLAIKYDNYNGV